MTAQGLPEAKANGFEISLLLVTAIQAAVYHWVKFTYEFILTDWKVYLLLAIFAVITYFSHKSMKKAIDGRPAQFANRFMGSILFKLLIGFILFIVIALISEKAEILPFGISFLIIYLVYTVFGSYQATRLNHGRGKEN